jgi:hypothetical protein
VKSQLWLSLAVVVVALLLLSFRRARNADGIAKNPFSQSGWTKIRLTAGADNRDSTSKTVVLGWTAIVAWVVIATVLLSKGDKDTFAGLMQGLGTPYFAVLGGPVLAAFLAKAVTDSKTSGDDASLQKTEAAAPALGDLVTGDNGGLSVADAQYLILNLCAAAFVIYAFAKHPDLGVPEFPEQLALLAGGSAATYAGTKGWTANAPSITAMTPTQVDHTAFDSVSIRGANLVSPGRAIKLTNPGNSDEALVAPSASATKVLIGGWEVPDDKVRARSDEVVITALPAKIEATAGEYAVSVVTAAGLKATSPDPLKVV